MSADDVAEVFDALRPWLAGKFHVEEASIGLDTRFVEEFGADSFDVVEMLIVVDEAYFVIVTDVEARTFATVGDACAFVAKHAGRDAPPVSGSRDEVDARPGGG